MRQVFFDLLQLAGEDEMPRWVELLVKAVSGDNSGEDARAACMVDSAPPSNDRWRDAYFVHAFFHRGSRREACSPIPHFSTTAPFLIPFPLTRLTAAAGRRAQRAGRARYPRQRQVSPSIDF